MDEELLSPSAEIVPVQDPIIGRLVDIGRIVSKYGNPPSNGSKANMRFMKTPLGKEEGQYTAVVNLDTDREEKVLSPYITLYKETPPKSTSGKEQANIDVTLSTDPEGVVTLIVDTDRVEEALGFEAPKDADGINSYKIASGNQIIIKAPIKSYGPKTRTYLDKLTRNALERFQNLEVY